MIIGIGEKIHVMRRRVYEKQVQRHFLGIVMEAEGAVVRAQGHAFIFDGISGRYEKKDNQRTTICDLAGSGYIVNVLPEAVQLQDLRYEVVDRDYTALVDGKSFELDINEFGSNR